MSLVMTLDILKSLSGSLEAGCLLVAHFCTWSHSQQVLIQTLT